MLTIGEAIDAFIQGWVFSRSMEREIKITKIAGGWLTHIHFGKSNLRPRPDEFHIYKTSPEVVIKLGRPVFQDIPHRLCVFTTNKTETLAEYARWKYRLVEQEYLMGMELTSASFNPLGNDTEVERVKSEQERQWFNNAHEREVIPPHALYYSNPSKPHRIRYYFVRVGNDLGCEGRSTVNYQGIQVTDSIYTHEDYRRRGLGAALMKTMLYDAADSGSTEAVLVASEDGRKLYLTLGYQVLADMLILEPD